MPVCQLRGCHQSDIRLLCHVPPTISEMCIICTFPFPPDCSIKMRGVNVRGGGLGEGEQREGGSEGTRESRAHTRSLCVREREGVSEWVGRGEGRRFKSNCYWSIFTSVQGGAAGVEYRELRGIGEKVSSPWLLRWPRAPQSHFAWAAFTFSDYVAI